jgi:hypothetical protein
MVELSKKAQLLGQLETFENTAETLNASDAVLALDAQVEPIKAMVSRETARTSLSSEVDVVGRTMVRYRFGIDLTGGGSSSYANAPPWGPYAEACGMVLTTDGIDYVKTDSTGVVAQIPAGIVLTGSSSASTAQVLFTYPVASGETLLFIRKITGAAYTTSEDLTNGGTTYASTASSGHTGTDGHRYNLTSIAAAALDYSAAGTGSANANELFIGGTSGAAGTFASDDGSSEVRLSPIAGVSFAFAAGETITGQTSAKTYTLSSPTGQVMKEAPTMSLAHISESRTISATGCRGTWVIDLTPGEPGRINFVFDGARNSDGVGAGLYTGVSYQSVSRLRYAAGAMLTATSYRFPVGGVQLDLGNTVVMQADPHQTSGDRGAAITARDPVLSHDPDHVSPSLWDWVTNWQGETTYAAHIAMGTSPGNRVAIRCPTAQITDWSYGDRDGIRTSSCVSRLTRSDVDGDDELVIYVA